MKLIIGKEYKLKEVVDGTKTPGGYYKLVKRYAGKVVLEVFDKNHERTGGLFTMSIDRFKKTVEDDDQ